MNTKLIDIAHDIRVDILKMYYKAGWGHLAPALSCVDILTSLYWGGIVNRENLFEEKHDHVILSKGHGGAALYAVLAKLGYFPHSELSGFYQKGSYLVGLASCKVYGVEVSTGSLGHGICFATGTALAAKLNNEQYRTYVVLGDGESQEGSVWEAAMFAGNHKLNNLITVLDNNLLQASDYLENIITIAPIRKKWEAFGWNVLETDGHDFDNLIEALDMAKKSEDKPTLIIANTIKGKGVRIAENNPAWHSRAPKGEEWKLACDDLQITMEELQEL